MKRRRQDRRRDEQARQAAWQEISMACITVMAGSGGWTDGADKTGGVAVLYGMAAVKGQI